MLQAVLDLYENDPFNTHCALPDTLAKLTCPQPDNDETREEYIGRLQKPIMNLGALLVQYAIDCVCKALLPPCPVDPGTDAVILACVTVRGGRSSAYATSVDGAMPAPSRPCNTGSRWPRCWATWSNGSAAGRSYCGSNSPLVNDLAAWLDKLDPEGGIRKALAEGDFALPRMYASQISGIMGKALAIRPLERSNRAG